MNTITKSIPIVLICFFVFCSANIYALSKREMLLNQGTTEFTPKHKLHDIGRFTGIVIQLPDSITVSSSTMKLVLKNGKEFNVYADLINDKNEIIKCNIARIGSSSVELLKEGPISDDDYKKIIIHSEVSFQAKFIEWFSQDID
jgi:hypothetical protein